jgi:hypothetical protein
VSRFSPPCSTWRWRQVQSLKHCEFHICADGQCPEFHSCLMLSLHPSPSLRDLMSHLYKTRGGITVLFVLIYIIIYGRHEDKWFWTGKLQAFLEFNLFLISVWNVFGFVHVLQKYLNYHIFKGFVIFTLFFWGGVEGSVGALWWENISIYTLSQLIHIGQFPH